MRTIEMADGVVKMIDQRKLPGQFEIIECRDYRAVAAAIKDMTIRGAPAIGAAAAFGLVLAAQSSRATTRDDLLRDLENAAQTLQATRPTAVNLKWAIDRVMSQVRRAHVGVDDLREFVQTEAQAIAEEDVQTNKRMAENGASLIDDGDTILHHCNTGPSPLSTLAPRSVASYKPIGKARSSCVSR
jgi:methylthioribose-1-phosphate isomerase